LSRGGSVESPASSGFLAAFWECVGPGEFTLPRRHGRQPRVPLSPVLVALVFHFMNAAGTLSEHFTQLFGTSMADSSLSERRTRMPWEVFSELMRRSLRPLASATAQAEAFWRGWRLVALEAPSSA